MTILDTDIVTLLSYGKTEKLRGRIEAVGEEEELAVTVVTRMEVLRGRADSILKASDEGELTKAMDRFRASEELLASFVLLEVGAEAAAQFGRLRKEKKLKKMGRGDMLNACIALAHDALLVTWNVRDCKAVPGLRVENWAD